MIPFSPPRIDQKIIDEVVAALTSGWITTGPRTKEFEKKLTAYSNHKATLCLNSASAGLELMLRWYGVKEGDEVIVPAYTYCATANVVIHCGATPIMVDVDDTYCMSVDAVAKAISKRTKVIIPVDLAGLPCDYDELHTLVNETSIKSLFYPETQEQKDLGRVLILSDAAHSVGATYKNKKAGALTDITVFSFHAVKNLTTAEGGAVCLNLPEPFDNEEIYKKLCIKSLHGQTKDALAKAQIGNWKYDVIEAGYKCNMTDIQAAIGLVELERYDSSMLIRRKKIFELYTELFKKYTWAEIPTYETTTKISSYHVYLLQIKKINEQQRDAIMQEIFAQGVSVNVHFIPLPMLTFYKNKGYSIEQYPNAYHKYSTTISLPVFFDLSDGQINQVVTAVSNAYFKVVG